MRALIGSVVAVGSVAVGMICIVAVPCRCREHLYPKISFEVLIEPVLKADIIKYNSGVLMTVTLKKVGGSIAMIIPKAIAQELDLRDGTAMSLTSESDSIVLRRPGRRPRRPLAEIVNKI